MAGVAVAAGNQTVQTVEAVVLLGWMEMEEAVTYLLESCCFEPALTRTQAEELWKEYKSRVGRLPVCNVEPPKRLPIPDARRHIAQEFLTRTRGPEVLDVINIDPMNLVVYQMYVVTDQADHHAKNHIGTQQWDKNCLMIDRPTAQMALRLEDGIIKIQLPHAEHMFSLLPNGLFQIQQGGGFISVCDVEGRLLLKAGYHRTFAFCRSRRNEPDAKDRSLLVALTKSVPPVLAADFPKQGLRTTVLGSRPPLFSDFFDDVLSIRVKLRKKRFEMHVKVDTVAVDV